MPKRTYSRHVPLFGSVAMVLLCTVFFLLPFALRGAKLSVADMQNNVADWLPDDYVETQELKEFSKYFGDGGNAFVVLSGDWCKRGNSTYESLLNRIRQESLEYEEVLKKTDPEELQAHRLGDQLGLLMADQYHESWGQKQEKWLMGRNGQWYFITAEGSLYRWEGQNNIVEGIQLAAERSVDGKNKVDKSFFIRNFGAPPTIKDGKYIPNKYYENPEKLFCRSFRSVITGPEVLEQMAGPEGTLLIGKGEEQEKSRLEAEIEAHKRLSGSLFGPTPAATFNWTFDSLLNHVDEAKKEELLGSRLKDPELRGKHQQRVRQAFQRFVDFQIQENYDGDLSKLCDAKWQERLELWYRLWYEMGIDAPERQTCFVVTLNEPVINELSRAIGRPILGKPRGRLLELATGICGISPENVRIGGPPGDNVAIDEEGTNTLLRLAGLSFIIGLSLAYLSFSSIRVALMLFFVGGVAAISSLAYVWFAGFTMDAILMSMPSLVYVLGLSSAVHIVNYYRDACYEDGPNLAVETAVSHSWFPCTLAAFTTGLGLISLTTSGLTPIYKFGLFSAIAVMATVFLLFTYLPSALYIWSPGYQRKTKEELETQSGLSFAVTRFWGGVGDWVIRHHWFVSASSVALLIFFAVGVTRIETSVQLLKLFDSSAKILKDYHWMEDNLGKLVPAEIAPQIELAAQQEPYRQAFEDEIYEREKQNHPEGTPREEVMQDVAIEYPASFKMENELRYSMLERVELSRRVRQELERFFGPDGMNIVGSGMSTDVFTPLFRIESQDDITQRVIFSNQLWRKRGDMLEQDYYALAGPDGESIPPELATSDRPEGFGKEVWRVSIRLAALNNVDYGQFVNDLKAVVEPILTAYRARTTLLKTLQSELGEASLNAGTVAVLGPDPDLPEEDRVVDVAEDASVSDAIDQTQIFAGTLQDLMENRKITKRRKAEQTRFYRWIDPNKEYSEALTTDRIRAAVKGLDCVVLIEDHPLFAADFINEITRQPGEAGDLPVLLDFRDHKFVIDPATNLPVEGMLTAKERKLAGEAVDISAIYTGIVPIVYKAQRSLLRSLIESIGLAFVMISIVMMLLLRPWGSPTRPTNLLNIRGGLISMLPNMFPVIVVFGFMGHMNRWFSGNVDAFLVDIGSMMTASVAMGVAVDDTIHFLNWYRGALAKGYDRKSSIKIAYERVATAMTQTTLIGGFGLAAFALSTFTPTQRFGVLMLILLGMALVGDLILLPALIAGPLGKYFGKELPNASPQGHTEPTGEPQLRLIADASGAATVGGAASPAVPEILLPPHDDASAEESRKIE